MIIGRRQEAVEIGKKQEARGEEDEEGRRRRPEGDITRRR
jgi:hypothetical protein